MPESVLDSLSVDRREEVWRHWNDGEPQRRIWIAEREGILAGFVATGPSRDGDARTSTGEVYAIYLQPDLIGTGLGRRLFEQSVDGLCAQGFTRATLWMLENNARARRFYEAAGWRADGERKSERLHGVDIIEVRYARALS